MKYKEFVGTLKSYTHLNCSVNGNPAYYGYFENENGETLSGRTVSDAQCGYGFLNNRNNLRRIRYHETKTGNVMFDYIDVLPFETTYTNVMEQLQIANVPEEYINHHESDLYLKATRETTLLISGYKFLENVTTFIDNIDHEKWYEIPFAYHEMKVGETHDSKIQNTKFYR